MSVLEYYVINICMTDGSFEDEQAHRFKHDLASDEMLMACESQVLDALQLQGIFIDLSGCISFADKAALLFRERKQITSDREAVGPIPDDAKETIGPGVVIDHSGTTDELIELHRRRDHIDRKLSVLQYAELIAIGIGDYSDDEDWDETYPVSSADYNDTRSYFGETSTPHPLTQRDETEDFLLHRVVVEIAQNPALTLDDRRALLAAMEHLVGAEEYTRMVHDIFRTDRGNNEITPNILNI